MVWWSIYLSAIALVMLVVWWRQGPRRALAAGIFLSLLAPEWLRYHPLGAPPENGFNTAEIFINVRVAVAIVGLCLYLLHPKSTYNFKLIWTDWAMLALVATHAVSDTLADGFQWTMLLRIYGEWVLPYLAGRVAIQAVGDARWALPFAVGVALVLAMFSVAEAVFNLQPNPSEMLLVDFSEGIAFDSRPIDGTPRGADRIGFKRAYGPTMHPIYFAALQFLLLPWMIYAAARSVKKRTSPVWWFAMPLVCAIGIAGPISRSPFVAMIILAYVMALIMWPQRRRFLGIAGAVTVVVTLLSANFLLDQLESFSGNRDRTIWTQVNGTWVRYTGERHRFMLFEVYAPALKETGLFGYGTKKLAGFPPRIPRATDNMQVAEEAPQAPTISVTVDRHGRPTRLAPTPKSSAPKMPEASEADVATLDNAFLLYTLRFGYVGLLCFVAVMATAAANYIRLALTPNAEGVVWLSAMGGTVVAMAFVLLTVWMPTDFGFFYLWIVGASAGLLAERENPKLPQPESSQSSRRRKRRRRSSHEEPWSGSAEDAGTDDAGFSEPISEESK